MGNFCSKMKNRCFFEYQNIKIHLENPLKWMRLKCTDKMDVLDWTSPPTSGLYEWVFVHGFLFARYSVLTVFVYRMSMCVCVHCVCFMLSMLVASQCYCWCVSLYAFNSMPVVKLYMNVFARIYIYMWHRDRENGCMCGTLTCVCEARQTSDRIVCRFCLLEFWTLRKTVEGIYKDTHTSSFSLAWAQVNRCCVFAILSFY